MRRLSKGVESSTATVPRRRGRLLYAAGLAAGALLSGAVGASWREEVPAPDPRLAPEEVVAIQLRALQDNDDPTPDAGIERTFAFASPANRSEIGPIDHFTLLLRSRSYAPLLYHRRATRDPIVVHGDTASQVVTIETLRGSEVRYLFVLSKQHAAPCKDCWMTDGVVRLEEPPNDGHRIAY